MACLHCLFTYSYFNRLHDTPSLYNRIIGDHFLTMAEVKEVKEYPCSNIALPTCRPSALDRGRPQTLVYQRPKALLRL